ncbi:MAG TPA: VanW family protein [Candidatus Portnoybacteria bacterium]|nr:VanW family protein [Candidatus Portnoybacteria bacterium]
MFSLTKKRLKTSGLVFLAVFLFGALAITSLAAVNHDQVIIGLTIGGFKAQGIAKEKLSEVMAEQIANFNSQKITFIYNEKSWELSPADFGLTINANKTASLALAAGHGTFFKALKEQAETLFAGQDIALDYSIDKPTMNRALNLLSSIETPVQDSSIKYDAQKNDFTILPAKNGLVIDQEKLTKDILSTFSEPAQNIALLLVEKRSQITQDELQQVIEEAKTLVANAPYFLQTSNATWRVEKTELADWISATPSSDDPQKAQLILDTKKIADFLSPLAASINREPINAKLTSENGQLRFATLSQNGEKLNIDDSAQKIAADIIAGKKNVYLITDSIAPQISNQNTEELGLLTLLGKGESNFYGSTANRRINIKVGSTKLNGFLIKPGEEFSFGQNIGEIDAANGWVPELVIKNNQTIPEYGGGLCQVSTTLFRATINSGLKITERHPHAYPVKYYDPPGFDATVYPPSPDLKFINDTPGHILLQSRIEGNKLFFEIYGTDDGREVKIKGPTITQKNPDGSLKTILTQQIWRDGKLDREQVFRSSYKSASLYPTVTATPTPTPTPTPIPTPADSQPTIIPNP